VVLRLIGAAAMVRDIEGERYTQSAKISANGSYVGTYDFILMQLELLFLILVVVLDIIQ
jgi:hypothetical protein